MVMHVATDPRVDPRLKAAFGHYPTPQPAGDVASRETLLAEAASEAARAGRAAMAAIWGAVDCEEVAPSNGLAVRTESFVSQPDGNRVQALVTRPQGAAILPCVVYLHGGGMTSLSAFDGQYRAWARLVAAHGVVVVAIDFRNAIDPSSAAEVAPYPAGLNDCVSGVRWVAANAAALGVDAARIVVAGESGGGNLTLAAGMKLKRDGEAGLLAGLYAMCPYIAGAWPQDEYPSSFENFGLFADLHNNRAAMAYGIEAFEARDPLAWPGFASPDDLAGLPPTVISVNECDPLRDEGIGFYRRLLAAGVAARGRVVLGTLHGTEIYALACPEISRDAAAHLASFAKG
jgi:acetyl esterase/lipase